MIYYLYLQYLILHNYSSHCGPRRTCVLLPECPIKHLYQHQHTYFHSIIINQSYNLSKVWVNDYLLLEDNSEVQPISNFPVKTKFEVKMGGPHQGLGLIPVALQFL